MGELLIDCGAQKGGRAGDEEREGGRARESERARESARERVSERGVCVTFVLCCSPAEQRASINPSFYF